MLEPAFLQMTTQTVKVESLSTASAYGAPSYAAAASSWPAVIEPGTRLTLNTQGLQEVATATVYVLSSSATIGMQDRITLHDGRTPKLLRVDTLNDEEGQHHLEVMIA
jgi:hypothetical protein